MKKLLLIFMAILLVAPFVVGFDFDNVASFDPNEGEYGTVTITNAFGLGDDLITLELTENTNPCATSCLAVKSIELLEDGSLIDDIRFDRLYKGDRFEANDEIAEYTLYVKDLSIYDVSDENWTAYTLGTEYFAGNYSIKLEATKPQRRTYDWVVKSQGEWLDQWALWSGVSFVYDEMDGATVNDSLWHNQTVDVGSGVAQIVIGGVYQGGASTLGGGSALKSAQSWLNSTALPDVDTIENITMRVYLLSNERFFEPWAEFSAFGHRIKRLIDTGGPADVDDSVWTLLRNRTCGPVCFTVFDDGVFEKSINATDNILNVFTYALGSGVSDAGAQGLTRIYYVYVERDSVILNSPADEVTTSNPIITFNGTATVQGANLTNMSLYHNASGAWQLNQTLTLSGVTNREAIFTVTLDGTNDFAWNYEACDTENECAFASQNRTVHLDEDGPVINIIAPTGTFPFGNQGLTVDLNYTVTDPLLEISSCAFTYNGVSTNISCVANYTTFSLVNGVFNLTVSANDTLGNVGSAFTSWNYTFFALNQTFNPVTIEGATEPFQIVNQFNQQITSITLNYGGTLFPSTLTNIGNLIYVADNTLSIPSVTTDTNVSFFYDILLGDGTQINSSTNIQLVQNLDIGNCTAFSNPILNYTLKDEETLLDLNGTVEVFVEIYPTGSTTAFQNYSGTFNNTNDVCVGINLGNSSFVMSSRAKYYSPDYQIEYHNIQRANLNETVVPILIDLFDLPSAVATVFQITYKGDNYLPIADALITISREYVGEGLFRTVEAPVTDYDGRAVASLRKDDTVYTFFVSQNGVLLGTFENIVPVCLNELTEECQINLHSFSSTTSPQDFFTYNNLRYTLTYDGNTRDITATFTVIDGSTALMELDAQLYNRFENTTICSDSLTSSAGVLTCNVPTAFDNSTVMITLSKDGSTVTTQQLSLFPDTSAFFGNTRIIFVLILMLTIPFMFITSLTGMVLGGIVGLIFATLLLLSTGGTSLGITASVAWLIISGIILIWRLKRQGGND